MSTRGERMGRENNMETITNDALHAQLERVAQHEAGVRNTAVGRLLQSIGPTRPFAEIYRRIGPLIDPWLLRVSGGRIATQIYGMPSLLLLSTGAKSGKQRTSPLLYARDGDDFLIVGTNFAAANHPAWTVNLIKHPSALIEVAQETLPVTAELVSDAEFQRYWPSFTRIFRGYDEYLKRLTDRHPRMFRLRPNGLAGNGR